MFSMAEKKKIAEAVEKVILSLNHPEMTTEKVDFTLHVVGKEEWNYAEIFPNWTFDKKNPPTSTEWNETLSREILD